MQGHGIQRVSRVGSSVGVDCVVGVAVVGDYDYFVIGLLGGLYGVLYALVNSLDLSGLLRRFGVTHHVAVGVVNHDEVVLPDSLWHRRVCPLLRRRSFRL